MTNKSAKTTDTTDQAPDYALDLYSDGTLLFDPHAIGTFPWPNPITLPGDLNIELTNIFYQMLVDDSLKPANDVLRTLFYLAGTLSFSLSHYNLVQRVSVQGSSGIFCAPDTNLIAAITKNTDHDKENLKPTIKDLIAVYSQKWLLRIGHFLGYRWKIALARHNIYKPEKFGKVLILRRFKAIFRVEKSVLSLEEKKQVKVLTQKITEHVQSLSKKYQIILSNDIMIQIDSYVEREISRAYLDLKSVQNFFGKMNFDVFERSLTPYGQSLLASVCIQNGGVAHSSFHGTCHSANEPDIATIVNCLVFWGITEAFTQDANELSERIPEKVRHFEIRNMDEKEYYKNFIKNGTSRDQIKHVAIMGRNVVHYSAFNSLEFHTYFELEKRVGNILLNNDFKVTYKAHPDCTWKHFDKFFDPRVKIDWRPFEEIMNEFDALFFHFGASSTMPHALGSNLHIFMLQDGWHDIRLWPSRIQEFFKTYANMVPGYFTEEGLIDLDEEKFLRLLKNPVTFSKEQRIHDFFCRKVF